MRFPLFVASAAAAWLASSAIASSAADSALEARGRIHDAMHIIERKGKCGLDFCSSYLHIPPPKTTTRTVTRTVAVTVPATTITHSALVTKSASAVTETSTQLVVVNVTPTISSTHFVPVPSTSAVTTITTVKTVTVPVSTTITVPAPGPTAVRREGETDAERRKKRVPIPKWLNGYCDSVVTKACNHFVSCTTLTRTKTVTLSKTVKSGSQTVVATGTTVVTPTATAVVSSTSTRTKAPVTSVVTATSSSLVGVTATDFQTTTVTDVVAITFVLPVSTTTTTTTPTTTTSTTTSSTTTSSTTTSSTTTSSTTTSSTTTSSAPTPTVTVPAVTRGSYRLKAVSTEDGTTLGYFGPLNARFGTSSLVTDSSSAVVFTFDASSAPFNIETPAGSSYPFLGAIFGLNSQGGYLRSDDASYLNAGYVAQVPAGQQASDGQNSPAGKNLNGPYESQIFSLDLSTLVLTLTWTNPDGSTIVPSLYYLTFGGGYDFFEWGSQQFGDGYSSSQSTELTLFAEPVN